MYVQIIGKQKRKVECIWGGIPCQKGDTVEEQNYCEHGGADGILEDFCEPKFVSRPYIIKGQRHRRIGYQKIGGNNPKKEVIQKAVEVCDDNGTDPVWTDEVHDGDLSYKFCQLDKIGIIFEEQPWTKK